VTVGFFSPLPPARTGVADYSAALLRALRLHHTIRVNGDGDVNIYHIGNNQLHAPIYKRALQKPGLVVFHDAVLHHFALGHFPREQYIQEFIYNYGEWARELATALWIGRARSAGDSRYYQYPMLKRIVERSLAIIVHNPAAAAIVRDHCPGARIWEIPHHFTAPDLPHPAEAERLRARYAIGPLFGVFGHLREAKRVLPVLRVFAEIPECTLLLAGEMASSDLRRAAAPYLSLPNVCRLPGYIDSKTYWQSVLAIDVCINLRYPAAGETSGVSVGLMGMGKPVIMTDSLENSHFPDATCLKISAGLSEAAELEAMVRWCAEHRAYSREIGLRAAAFIREEHDIGRVAHLYGRVLTAWAPVP
jgi:hypothetical protein